tara:strand:- start:1282 stop:1596 length:315 start_codon:yes stop_codon:yes gene_type:complete
MPIEITELTHSEKKHKRHRIVVSVNGEEKAYHFGLDGGSTYIDHKDEAKRDAYRKRHYANKKEKELIDHLIPSPALFSYKLLWGSNSNIIDNIIDLQKEFNNTP